MWKATAVPLTQSSGEEAENVCLDSGKDHAVILLPQLFSSSQEKSQSAKIQAALSTRQSKRQLIGQPFIQSANKPVRQQAAQSLWQSMTLSTRHGSVIKVVSINCGERCTQWLGELAQKWECIIMLLYLPLQFPSSLSGMFVKSPPSGKRSKAISHYNMLLALSCGDLPDSGPRA